MTDRKQIRRTKHKQREMSRGYDIAKSKTPSSKDNMNKERDSEFDDLLDEIDELLESNAEDFVKSYVQKGGQ
ncbi:MAG: ubiquitin-like protein Pup [Acidimicrobiaceae bacterium]|nr:ubiquitin-like protein Pup [Acidimicrobiaceae bacterium]